MCMLCAFVCVCKCLYVVLGGYVVWFRECVCACFVCLSRACELLRVYRVSAYIAWMCIICCFCELEVCDL